VDKPQEIIATVDVLRPMRQVWQDSRIRVVVATRAPALAGLFVALIRPRDPVAAPQALIVSALGLADG